MSLPAGQGVQASVIVVSRHRPAALERCLRALTRQSHPLELVLVADPGAVQTCPDLPIKRIAFDQANISAARNQGLAQAAGDVVLFIDDDALAGCDWVAALTAPFADPQVIAATGFTRGPDGLNWQSRAERIDRSGRSIPIADRRPVSLAPKNGRAVSTMGTNCAFRREALISIGGFDPAFAFHLDESDVNMRQAAAQPKGLTAIVPAAQVIHGLAPGTSRAQIGVPHDLYDIGRSTVIFARRHGGDPEWLRDAQHNRLLRLMVAGRLDPFAVPRIMATLQRGMADGAGVTPALPEWTQAPAPPFLPLPQSLGEQAFLAGWQWHAPDLRAQAAALVAQGRSVTLLLLSPSALPHRLKLCPGGWWEQVGGVWGPSQPGDSALTFARKDRRISREQRFSAATRH